MKFQSVGAVILFFGIFAVLEAVTPSSQPTTQPMPVENIPPVAIIRIVSPPAPLLIHEWDTEMPDEWKNWREEYERGDLDFDGMISQTDLSLCRWCMIGSGPAVPLNRICYNATTQPAVKNMRHCEVADLDDDGDVDGVDIGILQRKVGFHVPTSMPASSRPQ